MAKKQDLESLLASDTRKSQSQKSSKILEETIKKSTGRMEEIVGEELKSEPNIIEKAEEPVQMERALENPIMVEFKPSEADFEKIKKLEQENEYLVTILNVFTTDDEKKTATFNKDDTIQIHINCAVTKIFSQLSAEFQLDAISQDLVNLLPQRIYGFCYKSKLKYPYFEIIFETKAVLEGVFKYQIILTFGHVEYFCVHDACIYRVI